jgi:hypothetical protein
MIDLVYGPRATESLATSALPGAPVRAAAPASPRTRSVAAALLRRAADRLAPDSRGLPA